MPHQLTTTSRRYPRYLSFSPGELETQLRGLNQTQSPTANLKSPTTALTTGGGQGRSKLLKSHSCPVRFPDGREGCCHYTRGGPTWHLFRFDYVEAEEVGTDGTGDTATSTLLAIPLPVQYETKRLENDVASIELACREKAASAFRAAIERERREHFRRAAETASRKKQPHRFQMKANRAKELAGKYAVCQFIGSPAGKRLLPVGPAHDRLEDANREWQALQESRTSTRPFLVVACCNRLDRCWEIPRFNPLRALVAPRPQNPEAKRGEEDDWEFLPGSDESVENEETEEIEEDEP